MVFKARDRYFDLDSKPVIMGILNFTPDSFSDGGRFFDTDSALRQCEKMIKEGADIIDIGGESSRPGSDVVSADEELERIIPLVEAAAKNFDICLSIDTYKSSVAAEALNRGAHIVNNIFGIKNDDDMIRTVAENSAGYCIMHMRGTPKDMQKDTSYFDLVGEISSALFLSAGYAVSKGVLKEAVIIDPGIGFGKDLFGNLEIIRSLDMLTGEGYPVLIGVSRKRFIGDITGLGVNERLPGALAANVISLANGARIFRVHDVLENRSALDTAWEILHGTGKLSKESAI
jgi:dihydropteroate synthase